MRLAAAVYCMQVANSSLGTRTMITTTSPTLETRMKTITVCSIRVAPRMVATHFLILSALAISAAFFLHSVPAVAGQPDPATHIRQLEHELTEAFNKYDATALDRLWDRDLTFVFPNGVQAGKTERLAAMAKVPGEIPQSTNETLDVKILQDAAVAVVVSRWLGIRDGKTFSMRFRATHVWVKRGADWKLLSAHVSQMKD